MHSNTAETHRVSPSRRRLRKTVRVIDDLSLRLSGFGRELAAAAIILMTALVAINAIARITPGINGLTFVEEYAGYLFVAITFMGLADTFRTGGHIRVEFLNGRLPRRPAAVLELFVTLAAIGIITILAWYAAELLRDSLASGERAQTVTQTPLWIPHLFLLPGYLLLLLELVTHALHALLSLLGISSEES